MFVELLLHCQVQLQYLYASGLAGLSDYVEVDILLTVDDQEGVSGLLGDQRVNGVLPGHHGQEVLVILE